MFGNVSVCAGLKPIGERVLARDFRVDRIRVARRNHLMKNFPDRFMIGIGGRPNAQHAEKFNFQSATLNSLPLIGFWIPEWTGQTKRVEDRHYLIGCGSTRFDGETIRVPMDGELPELVEINKRPARNIMGGAPEIDGLFRPEEEHGRSGENEIVPPMRRRLGEVREIRFQNRLTILHFEG